MRDNELILEILHQIQKSAQRVVQRFQSPNQIILQIHRLALKKWMLFA